MRRRRSCAILFLCFCVCEFTRLLLSASSAFHDQANPVNGDGLMIVVTIKERIGYVELLADILDWLEVYDKASVHLFVDETPALTVATVISMFPSAEVHPVQHTFYPETSADISTRIAFEYFYRSGFDIIVNIDSDTALHPDWLNFIQRNLKHSRGVMSLYNSAVHPTNSCSDEVCWKDSIGAMGVVMTRQMVGDVLENVPYRIDSFDWGFVDLFRAQGVQVTLPRKSLALHYGMHGSNGNGSHIEHGLGFDESVFPDHIRERVDQFVGGKPP